MSLLPSLDNGLEVEENEETMRAIAIENAFGLENVHLVERPVPTDVAGHVRVRMAAASLNYRDYLMATGSYNPRQPLPLILGSDGAGTVIGTGEGVARFRVGDRVMSVFAQDWISGSPTTANIRSTLGGPRDGVLAEEVLFPEQALTPVPAHLSLEEAATLPCAAVTAYSALTQCGVGPGQTVLVQGTGGVSLFALSFAKLFGATVIVTSKSDEKLARAKKLGADCTINYGTTPEWGKAARALVGGEGVDLVIEVGGAGTLAQSVRATRPGGSIALIGVLAAGSESSAALSGALTTALMTNIRIQGVFVGSRQTFEAMCAAIDAARLRPVISETFPMEDTPKALAHMAAGSHFGKIVITI